MTGIQFTFTLLERWPEKVKQGSEKDVTKLYTSYINFCISNDLLSESVSNLVLFIESQMPLSTRHDIYLAAQVQLLDELLLLRDEPIGALIAASSNPNEVLGLIHSRLDVFEDDNDIDIKLKNKGIKWDSSAG